MTIQFRHITIALLSITALLGSCDNKPDTTPGPPKEIKYGNLQITVIPRFNKKLFRLPEYKDTLHGGRKIVITKAQMYLSDFTLTALTGADKIVDGIVLYKPGTNTYTISTSAIVDDYNNTKFLIGLNNAVNAKPPEYHSALSDSSMWFPNTSGSKPVYAFLIVQGLIDTTAAANGTANVPFNYTLGTQNMLTQVELGFAGAISVYENTANMLNVTIDFARLFDGVDFSKEEQRVIDTPHKNITQGDRLKNNIPRMITVTP